MNYSIALLFLSIGLLQRSAAAATVTVTSVADTALFAQNATNNLGGATNFPVGSNASLQTARGLLKFDIASNLPSNAIIQSAALTLTVQTVPGGGGTPSTFDLRPMVVSWTEGTGTGTSGRLALTGESTWNHRAATSITWSTPGGSISNEYSPTVSSSVAINALGTYTFPSTANTVGDVQQWLNQPGANNGWAVFTEAEGSSQSVRRFASRENGVNVPSLAITYVLAPVVQNVVRTNNQIQFSFAAAAGQGYAVQYSDGLGTGSWSNLFTVPAPAGATNIVITDGPVTNLQRYYRLLLQ